MKKISIHKPAYSSVLLLILFALIAGGCKREKLSNTIPLLNVANASASGIRMFNFTGGDANVTVNNIPLTAYGTIGSTNPTGGGTQIGLALFPTGMWTSGDNASPFSLPNSLLDKDGNAHFLISGGSTLNAALCDTVIANDVLNPKDYYLLPDGHIKVLTRDNVPAANAENFKIRIINLGTAPDMLDLAGPVSLTFADGSVVNTVLNNVAPGTSSPYTELSYGSYQFKLFIAQGAGIDVTKQLSEEPNSPFYDPCHPTVHPQEGISPRVRTFKPGGVYSIVITKDVQHLNLDCSLPTYGGYANAYHVITELDPGVNSTYARMQAVNAMPGKQVTITVDGKPLGSNLPYVGNAASNVAQQFPYQIFIQGKHHIQAIDQGGAVLAEGDLSIYPYDNYTIWAYNKPDGKAAVLFESNDMSGTVYTSTYHPNGSNIPDDGTSGIPRRSQFNYTFESRFLNLSPDLPYATFTNDHQLFLPAVGQYYTDTLRYFSAYVNMAPGIMPPTNSSLIYNLQPRLNSNLSAYSEFPIAPKLLRVYQSAPGNPAIVPGTVLTDIAPLSVTETFIANPNLYTSPYTYPETGVYTVALVGKTFTASQPSEKARLIVIKHNK